MDGGLNVSTVSWTNRSSDIGFNGAVYALKSDGFSGSYLYAGGSFNKTGTSGSYSVLKFGCIDTNTLDLYAIDDNSGSVNGFNDDVLTISTIFDRIFIGGNFTSQTASQSGIPNTYNITYGCVWFSNGYTSNNLPEYSNIGSSPSIINNIVYTSAKDLTTGLIHIGGDFTGLDGYDHLANFSYADLTTISSLATFTAPCYSLQLTNNQLFGFENNGNLWKLYGSVVITSSFPTTGNPIGALSVCWDGTFYQFFSNTTTNVTAYNPSQLITIDLTSLSISILSGGTIYNTNIVLNSAGAYLYGVGMLPNAFSANPFFVITDSYNVTFS
jgi:hypothetical protein